MKRSTKILYYILMLAVAAVTTRLSLSYMVSRPDSLFVEIGGDSMKNYYSFIYHALFGDGFKFMGMNYPIGENIIYADGQPLLSILLQKVGISSYEQALTVIHLAIVAGFFLCIVYCYKILCYYKVHPLVAMLGASLLTIMSPQIYRVLGHFGLSYMCIVPMLFYWTIRYNDTQRIIYILYTLLAGCLFSLLHPYLGALVSIWVMFYMLTYIITERAKMMAKVKFLVPLVIVSALIVVFVKLVLVFTDPVTDRSTYPLGMFNNCITYKSVLISNISSFWQLIFNGKEQDVGDGGYLGLVGTLIFFVGAVLMLIRLIGRKQISFFGIDDTDFNPRWILLAIFVLIFAHGAPLVWMKKSIDYISALRQFRTLGRFVWIFYYISAIYVVIIIYRGFILLRQRGAHTKAFLLLFISFGIWAYEAKGYVDFLDKKMLPAAYNYDFIFNKLEYQPVWDDFLAERGYSANDFQAILGLPYYHIGSEKLWIYKDNAWMSTIAIATALRLHLPIMDVNMSRTSWSQTFQQVRILSGLYSDKSILDSLPNDKPILVLYQTNIAENDDTKLLLRVSDSLGIYGDDLGVYALDPVKLKHVCDSAVSSALAISDIMTSTDSCIGCDNMPYVIDHFDDKETTVALSGQGAWLPESQNNDQIFRRYSLNRLDSNEATYELSIWVKVNNYDHRSPVINAEFTDDKGVHVVTHSLISIESTDNYGDIWLRASLEFSLPGNVANMNLYMGTAEKDNYIALDELLLRPISSLVVQRSVKKGGEVFISANGHIISKKKQ